MMAESAGNYWSESHWKDLRPSTGGRFRLEAGTRLEADDARDLRQRRRRAKPRPRPATR